MDEETARAILEKYTMLSENKEISVTVVKKPAAKELPLNTDGKKSKKNEIDQRTVAVNGESKLYRIFRFIIS